MKKVQSYYVVKEDTMALLPAKSFEYYTTVITSTGKLYVKMTPFEIIKESCLRDMATYEGRKAAVQQLTGFKNKVPILINSVRNIFGFPTSSPSNEDCIWLFYHHIKDIKNNLKSGGVKEQRKSTIHFTNHSNLPLDVSYFTLQQQYYRTAVCKSKVHSQKHLYLV